MTKKIFRPVSYLLILAMGLAMTFTSCEKTPDAMDLPPKESLSIALDVFPSDGSNQKSADAFAGNWLYSAGNVLVWNVVLAANVAIPVFAYAEAFNNTPVYLGDDTWEWAYSVTTGGATYVASLIGERENNEEFTMKMYLTKSGVEGFDSFLWFSGLIRYDHTAANWNMNLNPSDPDPFMDIAYHKDFEAGTADIRYTCVDAMNDLYEGFIEYGVDPEFDYDAYYTISRSVDDVTYIEWNTISAAGRVADELHFGDDLWHYWDATLLDVAYPVE